MNVCRNQNQEQLNLNSASLLQNLYICAYECVICLLMLVNVRDMADSPN